jgi:hypothetical protein
MIIIHIDMIIIIAYIIIINNIINTTPVRGRPGS